MSKTGEILYGKEVCSGRYDNTATSSLYGETYTSLFKYDECDSRSGSVYDLTSLKVEYSDFALCEKNDVPRLLRVTHEPPPTEIDNHILREKCADPAVFYPMLEETNCKKRLDEISHVKHPVARWNRRDPFTEDNVAIQYLNFNPMSFFILGKPELGQTEVARLLSARWKCVDLNPFTVVQDEIKLGTRIGKCFEFNLKCGRPIRSDVILRLIEKRVNTKSAEHRGFVLSGFPMIFDEETPKLPLITESAMLVVAETLEDILPSEETLAEIFLTRQMSEPIPKQRKSVAFVKEAFEIPGEFGEEVFGEQADKKKEVGESKESVANEEILEQEVMGEEMGDLLEETFDVDMLYEHEKHEWTLADDIDVGDTSEVDINQIEKNLWKPAEQMKFLFDLIKDHFIMVYMSCDNLDAVQMRLNPHIFYDLDVKQKNAVSTSTITVASKRHSLLFSQPVYPLPTLNKTVISKMIYQYNIEALPLIERRALQNRADYFIKVDARLSPTRINEIILTRLKILAIPPIFLPELLNFEQEQHGENIDEDNLESELQASEKHLEQLRYQNVVSPMYRLTLSNWNYKCPVATKHGIIIKGRADKAVKLMNNIFFLSNDKALLSFYRNPRPYIQSLDPLPCKVWIFGPDCSGRTSLAENLARILNAVVINPERLKELYAKQERMEFRQEISANAIKDALQKLTEIREKEKQELIKNWVNKAQNLLEKALEFYCNDSEEESIIGEDFPRSLTEDELNEELQSMNLPGIKQINIIEKLLQNEEELSKYMPYTLLEPLNEIDAFHPFVISYVDNVLQSTPIPDVVITPAIYATIIKQEITKIENDHYRIFEKKPTIVVDGMPIALDVIEEFNYKAFPDYTICLKDNDPQHSYLVDRLINSSDEHIRQIKQYYINMRKFETVSLAHAENEQQEGFHHHLEQPHEYNSDGLHLKSDVSLTEEISKLYAENIERFNAQWNISSSYFTKNCMEFPFMVDVTNKTSEEIVDEVKTWLENRFRQWAVFMTEELKKKEKEDFLKSVAPLDVGPEVTGEGEEEVEGEGKETHNWNELFLASRRLGNTGIYCPVAYNLHSVLWKGKEQFTAKFKEKTYYMSNQHALDLFLKSPYNILQPYFIPTFPPPRILIFGAEGSGKTSLAKYLADELKLYHLHIELFIMKLLNIEYLNNLSEALTNENVKLEPRQLDIINDYLNGDGQAAQKILKVILNTIWHEEPYKTVGFILEGFPRKKAELDMMIENYFIPDVVIELYVTQNDSHRRSFPLRIQAWRDDLYEKQCKRELEKSKIYNQWRHEKSMNFDFLMNQKKEERVRAAMEAMEKRLMPSPEGSHVSVQSVDGESDPFFYNYTEDEKYEDMMEVEEILKKELPEPRFDDKWENEADAADHIRKCIDENYLKEISDLDVLRPEFLNANIDHELIDTSGKPSDYVKSKSFEIVERFLYRNPAIFEDVQVINTVLAEKLLEDGFFFLSKFGRLCPVQVLERCNPIHMYIPGQETNAIHTLLHRRYIYFVYGEENCKKFKQDPVKYVMNDNIEFPLLPIRIAIIGPPKCGKSTLAKRFQEDYGLQVITRGGAVRYVLDRFPDGELSKTMRSVLEKGWCLTDDMVARAVEALTLDGASVYQGFILDGFPLTVGEMKHLSARNIIPFAVLDIEADLEKIRECSKSFKKDNVAYTYSFEYTKSTYGFWARNRFKIRDWLRKQYQNIYTLNASKSKWHLWDEARRTVFSALFNIHGYLKDSKYNSAHLINSLCVNSEEFEVRQSHFKNFCPCCLMINKLHYRESTPDWKNIVLYGNCYYAICPDHVQAFLDQPYKYLPPINNAEIPKHIPQIVTEVDLERVHQDGFCIVTFWDSMPKCNLVKGDPSIAACFRKRYCLFCSEECRTKFMQFPLKYFGKKIHFRKMNALSFCELDKLPTMGYLEQFVAAQLTEALVKAESERPYCPGLGIQLSVLLYIGFYLKIHNPKTRKEVLPFVRSAFEMFLERRAVFQKALLNFKSLKNPYKKVLTDC